MFKNYLTIAFRNLIKHKTFSFINIIGLSVGLASALLILLWIQHELSYDKFHKNKDVVYRVVSKGKEITFFEAPAPLAPTIKDEIPEIVNAVRVRQFRQLGMKTLFKYGENAFYETNGLFADHSFFQIFTFPFIKGDPKTSLSNPMNIILTENMAQKYFGDEDPINKVLESERGIRFTVKGILKNISQNSHIQFDYFLPYQFLESFGRVGQQWGDFNFMTYIQIDNKNNMHGLSEKITNIARNHHCPQVQYGGLTFFIQPLNEMYLHPYGNYDIPLGDIKYVYIFSIIAIFILLVACINFINLSTAKAFTRTKEVGLRKVVGANRKQLFIQFLGEFIILSMVSLGLALFLVELLHPIFNNLVNKNIIISYFNYKFIINIVILMVISGLIAGSFPAIYLSSFRPVRVLKNLMDSPSRKTTIRKCLVIFQFTLSVILITCTAIVFQQLQYIGNKSWNIENDTIIHFPVKENIGFKYETVKNKLLQHPNIISVTLKDVLPTTMRNNTTGVSWQGKTSDQNNIHMETTRVGLDYFKTFDLKIVEGRTFSKNFSNDPQRGYILNEEAIRQIKMEDPIGKTFALYGNQGQIIGIVRNSFYQSLKQVIHPQVFHLFTNLPREAFFGSVFIRVHNLNNKAYQSSMKNVISYIENVWKSVNTTAPFEYHFMDETIEEQYKTEQRLGKLFSYLSLIAILISCLGLFSLVSFSAAQRTKEIGIRKVLGASVSAIVLMLSSEFTKWILFANLIAWPVTWYVMNQWLQNFAYRIDISLWTFVLAGGIALIIALLTVSWQAVRAATTNPVEALRYE